MKHEGGGGGAAAEDRVEEVRRGGVEARGGQRGGQPLRVGVVTAEEAVRELRGGGEPGVGAGCGETAAEGYEREAPHRGGGPGDEKCAGSATER